MNFDTRKLIILGLLFVFGFPMLISSRSENEFSDVNHFIVYEIIWWVAVAALLLFVLFAEKRPLSSVGYHRLGLRGAGIGIAAGILLMAGLAFIYYAILPALHLSMAQQAGKLLTFPFLWRLILVIRGVVAGELFYRGYAIERLQELTRSRAIAGITSCAFFVFADLRHLGPAQLLFAGFAGIILTLFYIWRRNLWENMITHAVVDVVGVLAA